jgi:hypothetical protein
MFTYLVYIINTKFHQNSFLVLEIKHLDGQIMSPLFHAVFANNIRKYTVSN